MARTFGHFFRWRSWTRAGGGGRRCTLQGTRRWAVHAQVPRNHVLSVRLVIKEWQFSDGSISLRNSITGRSQPSIYGSSNLQSKTGRKLMITVVEGKNLINKSGKCDPYVKLQYGKAVYRNKTILHTSNPVWNQMFDLQEIEGGEYLKIKCYNADKFGDETIGSAQVNLEGIEEGTCRDMWVPLEQVSSGKLRLQIEAVKSKDYEGYRELILRTGIPLIMGHRRV